MKRTSFLCVLVLKVLVGLHRIIQLKFLYCYWWGIGLDYCNIEWFVLEMNRKSEGRHTETSTRKWLKKYKEPSEASGSSSLFFFFFFCLCCHLLHSLVFHRQTPPLIVLSSSFSHLPHTLGYSIIIISLNFPFLTKILHLFFFPPLNLSELVL